MQPDLARSDRRPWFPQVKCEINASHVDAGDEETNYMNSEIMKRYYGIDVY